MSKLNVVVALYEGAEDDRVKIAEDEEDEGGGGGGGGFGRGEGRRKRFSHFTPILAGVEVISGVKPNASDPVDSGFKDEKTASFRSHAT